MKYAAAFGRELRGFSKEALEVLEAYPYPGNVRELENVVERAVALETGEVLTPGNLSPELRTARPAGGSDLLVSLTASGFDLEQTLLAVERHYVGLALERTGGNKTEAARLLGLTFRSLRYRLEKLGDGS